MLKESNKSRFDSYSVRKVYWSYPIIPFRIVACTVFPTTFLEIAVCSVWLIASRLRVTRATGTGVDGKGEEGKTLSFAFHLPITPCAPRGEIAIGQMLCFLTFASSYIAWPCPICFTWPPSWSNQSMSLVTGDISLRTVGGSTWKRRYGAIDWGLKDRARPFCGNKNKIL